MLDRMLLGAEAGEKIFVEDVFSTYIYTGGTDQNIINNIDLVGKGGLVWIKIRNATDGHALFDTDRGVNRKLISNSSGASSLVANSLTNFYSSGFRVGGGDGAVNSFGGFYGSWTFRKSPKFFDVVTYTGNGVAGRAISHSLGVAPGMVIVKATSTSDYWWCWHRAFAADEAIFLNTTGAKGTYTNSFPSVPTATNFTVGSGGGNANGVTYVAYLFAHDATADGIIQCGSYVGNGLSGGNGPVVTLGWEPQWVLIKNVTTGATDWYQFDNMRGLSVSLNDPVFFPNLSNGESSSQSYVNPTATGFQITSTQINASGNTYIYTAIRRGPMRAPTLGTDVFKPDASTSTGGTFVSTGFPIDSQLTARRFGADHFFVDKLRFASSNTTEGGRYLQTTGTVAEATGGTSRYWRNVGYDYPPNLAGQSNVIYSFRRAPSFFDVVCYTGNFSSQEIKHNLGVVPELIILKARTASSGFDAWFTGGLFGSSSYRQLFLNTVDFAQTRSYGFFDYLSDKPTSSGIYIGQNDITNTSGGRYVAYLFASAPGVSKVGSYTGNGSSQTINCAFSAGARFVMIKRTDGAGDWYVWDTARGIVAGNDPHLSLNTTAAEVTTDDTIDTDSSGFVVNQVSATNVNVNTATYIYLAIA